MKTHDPATACYLIGQRLNPNRGTLLQNAATLLGKAGAEPLPPPPDRPFNG